MNENQLLKTMESTGITTWPFDEINLALDNLLERYTPRSHTKAPKATSKNSMR